MARPNTAGVDVPVVNERAKAGSIGRPRIRLTPAGYGFVAMLIVGFVMGVNYASNVIFAMVFLLVGILLMAAWQTWQSATGIVPRGWSVEPAFVGEHAYCLLAISEIAGRRHEGLRLDVDVNGRAPAKLVRAHESEVLVFQRHLDRRGWTSSIPAAVVCDYPLGLFQVRIAAPDLPRHLVYPRPFGTKPLPTDIRGRRALRTREADTFDVLKRYTAGDPAPHIAWKALARTDELMTKTFDGADGNPELWLYWNDVEPADREGRLCQLAKWVLDAERRGFRYGLVVPDREVPPGRGGRHRANCLRVLAEFGLDRGDAP